jgi:NarL family two-component system response regulator LiaR
MEHNLQSIRVMIVDDHPMVRDGLRVGLTVLPNLEVVGEAENGADAIKLCAQTQPDVVLMDMMMPQVDGATATQTIRRRFPAVQVIALTSFEEPAFVQRAIQAGAIGYILKNVTVDKLAEAIKAAYAGRPTLAPEAARALMQRSSPAPLLGADLTGRERETLALLVEGLTNQDIATRLSISESTTRFHVSNVLAKLNAANRTEAVRLALEHKLV